MAAAVPHRTTTKIINRIKKLLLAVATLVATMGFAFAQVDVNRADAAALDAVNGIGPKTAKAIVDERTKGGAFKDWADFEKRVQGVGPKNAKQAVEQWPDGGRQSPGRLGDDGGGAESCQGQG